MSVPNQTPYIIYNANGLTTVFPFEFYIINSGDIQVTINGTVVTSGYSVTGVGNTGGGDVTFITPPTSGSVVMLERVVPTYRLTDYQDNGDLLADTVNKDFDRLWMAIQRSFIYLGLALRRPLLGGPFNAEGYQIANLADPANDQDAATKSYVDNVALNKVLRVPENYVAPVPELGQRANKLLAFNAEGNPITVLPASGSASDVMLELAKPTGASLSGYKNPQSQLVETVKLALDKINVRLIYASDFGVKTDGSDNADALWNLGQFISNATVPLYVIFPKGVSLVGSQEFAGATGKGYSYRPSYFSRAWGDASDRGWFSIHRTNNDITLDMSGWTLKINNGMKQGSFDPVTGAVYNPASLPFYNYDYQAGHGFIFKAYKAPNLKLIGGKIDGNIPGASWGGKFGDDGYQVPSYNVWINECAGIDVNSLVSDSSPVDCIYINNGIDTGAISPLSSYMSSRFNRVIATNAGRNCWSYTGGHDDVFNDCIGTNAGSTASGISTHFSSPQASIDIESEAGAIARLTFNNCKFTYGGLAGMQTYGPDKDINDIRVNGGILHALSGGNALHNTTRNTYLRDVKIIGSIVSVVSAPSGRS
ncbi:phage tail fiber protein [Enterobacter hormaechei]|uniref:phage tail fiber domain-containing protein n=1 Tax=Enterobacter hormaechei TaxID=158836 RepID=UPI0007350E2B|nr:phage tail fiber protein [Enterobacter hormaechei]KTH84515.1 hypothetical protein ASV17_16425 [Enterobacter hormaechei subsp. xiangfangensis]